MNKALDRLQSFTMFNDGAYLIYPNGQGGNTEYVQFIMHGSRCYKWDSLVNKVRDIWGNGS